MDNYENLGTIGEGTYGVVIKCRHKITGQIVAIKKFKESDEDEQVKKTALREIKILKQLRHENIVSLLEVFRVRGKLYLVFEYVERTILEEIERHPDGLEPSNIRRLMWQLVRAIQFCHSHNIMHRDIKPENLLVSPNGVLKLCDFGFARPLAGAGGQYTEYVSTRWYRAPELLVGDVSYGKAVDVWSIGCMLAEITTGMPLFPGDSDIDQLYHIIKCLGRITPRHQELFRKNSLYVGVKLPTTRDVESLESRFPHLDKLSVDFMYRTIQEEPLDRWTCSELLQHAYFENCASVYEEELKEAIAKDEHNAAMAIKRKRGRKQLSGMQFTAPISTSTSSVSVVYPVNGEDNNSPGSYGMHEDSPNEANISYRLPTLSGTSSSVSPQSTCSSTTEKGKSFPSSRGSSLREDQPQSMHKPFKQSMKTLPEEKLNPIHYYTTNRQASTSYGGRIRNDGPIGGVSTRSKKSQENSLPQNPYLVPPPGNRRQPGISNANISSRQANSVLSNSIKAADAYSPIRLGNGDRRQRNPYRQTKKESKSSSQGNYGPPPKTSYGGSYRRGGSNYTTTNDQPSKARSKDNNVQFC